MSFEKRPLALAAIFLITGIIGGYYIDRYFLYIIAGLTIICILSYKYFTVTGFTIIIILILLGFSWIFLHEINYTGPHSLTQFNNRVCRVKGEIRADLTSLTGEKILLIPHNIGDKQIDHGLIYLNKRYLPPGLKNGHLVEVDLSLRKPEVKKNPGGFSHNKYLKKRGIYSLGYICGEIDIVGFTHHPLKNRIIELKSKLIRLLDSSLNYPFNEIVKALVLGERDNIPERWREGFSRAGANHLLAISGLHVGFIVLILVVIFSTYTINPLLKNLIITLILIIYILMTGVRASVLRAGILSILFLWAPFFGRQGDLLNIAGLAVIINLIINPYSLFTVGFQLSYLVLFVIIFWVRVLQGMMPVVLAVSVAAQLGSIPLTAFYFNLITPVGIITNIWAIPLVAFLVIFVIIALILGLIHPVFMFVSGKMIEIILKIIESGINLMVDIPIGNLEVAKPSIITLISLYIIIFVFPVVLRFKYLPHNELRRYTRILYTCFLVILLVVFELFFPPNNEVEILFMAVGQGDGILINLPADRHIIIDGGGRAGLDSDMGEYVLLPYLKSRGIKTIDLVFVTHFDSDHARGIKSILATRKVKKLILPAGFCHNRLARDIIDMARVENIPIYLTKKGDIFKFNQDLYLKTLYPVNKGQGSERNKNSIVLKLKYKNFTSLFTGDLGKEGEYLLLNSGLKLKCNILKIGHHGSDTSSSLAFLYRVSPGEAVISVGENNYGHPDKAVLKRLEKMSIRKWRTDRQGAIIVKTDGSNYKIKGYK